MRYKQTVLGVAWAFLPPLMAMVIFSIFFGRLAKMPSDGVPYPVFVYCGLLPWQLFSQAVTECGNSLVGNQHLITKVYFPRLIIPIAGVLAATVDFAIAFLLLLGMQVYYGIYPHARLLLFPLFILFAMVTALAIGIWLSALNVKYRDVRYLIPFLTQLWLFATPVAYPSSLVPARWRPLVGLNPMAGVVEGFRWALLGTRSGAGPLAGGDESLGTERGCAGRYRLPCAGRRHRRVRSDHRVYCRKSRAPGANAERMLAIGARPLQHRGRHGQLRRHARGRSAATPAGLARLAPADLFTPFDGPIWCSAGHLKRRKLRQELWH